MKLFISVLAICGLIMIGITCAYSKPLTDDELLVWNEVVKIPQLSDQMKLTIPASLRGLTEAEIMRADDKQRMIYIKEMAAYLSDKKQQDIDNAPAVLQYYRDVKARLDAIKGQ